MTPDVKSVQSLGEYRLRLEFDDGTVGEVDLHNHIVGQGGVFAPLEDLAFFQKVKVSPDIGTIVWPNDADFSPSFLYDLATSRGQSRHRATA